MKYIISGIISTMLCMMNCRADDEKDIKKYIEQLSDKEQADEAYIKIRNAGYDAIPYLLEKSNSMDIYYGTKIYNIISSFAVAAPTVGLTCLYLIDCIVIDRGNPHLDPLIIDKNKEFFMDGNGNPQTDPEVLRKAIAHYKTWWNVVKDMDKSKMKKVSPLSDNKELYWF
jgi:hypothetical protein